MADALLSRLARLDACAVSDSLDRLGITGALLGLSALSSPTRIAGRAVTIHLGPSDGRPADRHLCTAGVEASGPGNIIMIAHDGRTDVSGWGGILSLAAVTRGVNGVVIDGACRDLDESREYGLALYGRNAVPVTARGRIIELDWNVPVTLCGVVVAPDDLVIADASGVVVVTAVHAEKVIAFAEAIVAKEKLMAEAVRRGDPVSKVMSANYENMLRRENG